MKQFDFSNLKKGKKIVILTAYDCQVANILEKAGIDFILVGDSLGMVVLGHKDTKNVSMQEMLHHTKAVAAGAKNTPIIGDLPANSYNTIEDAVHNAKLFLDAGASAVKLEGNNSEIIRSLVSAKIPVVGHLGLLPQTAEKYSVQGTGDTAKAILQDSLELDSLGVIAIVLECIPDSLAKKITESVSCPTIGIGAGAHCDGQVLVINDLIGLNPDFNPKFVKKYADIAGEIKKAAKLFKEDVLNNRFPDEKHSFQ
ncbi:MAG: 3-methyl-2-oxobutanoate hydroxymethyltransferase [archaeon]|jgi:3-methyl-2-oxobutanoate hydroxymethyltransferase|nr:3-methyl-2-oxobutanoate hydroxymethyltransferase [archaeon]